MLDTLTEVLNSEEYRGDPRYIADAMAGVPTIAWSTSLKRCGAHPSEMAIGLRALCDHLQRNLKGLYLQVINVKTPERRTITTLIFAILAVVFGATGFNVAGTRFNGIFFAEWKFFRFFFYVGLPVAITAAATSLLEEHDPQPQELR